MMLGGWLVGDLTFVFTLAFVGAGLALLMLAFKGQIFLGPIPSISLISGELLSLGPFLIIGIFGWLSGYGMNFIVNLKFQPLLVATFTFLFTIASINQMIANSLNMVWSPRFYYLYNSGDIKQAESRSRFFFGLLAVMLGIIGLLAVALLPWVTNMLGGNLVQYGGFRLELAFLMSGYVVCIAWWHGQNYYLIAGNGKALMHLSLWSGGIGLLAWIFCMIVLGPVGIFVGFTVQMAVKVVSMRLVGVRHWPMRPPWVAIIIGCILTFSGLFFPLSKI
jgi:O-antigen/teichoic acid export membrane protein